LQEYALTPRHELESICGQTTSCTTLSILCLLYDFQTLLTGLLAIAAAIFAGLPVWRQLKDSNLQARISHRETLATLLGNAQRLHKRVKETLSKPLVTAADVTHGLDGEARDIDPHDAHGLEQMFSGVLDWYLITLSGTEHADIENEKANLRGTLERLMATLNDAHWAAHNFQSDEDHNFTDEKWAEILADHQKAQTDAAARVADVQRAYRALQDAQQLWTQSLRGRIAKLDLEIAEPAIATRRRLRPR